MAGAKKQDTMMATAEFRDAMEPQNIKDGIGLQVMRHGAK
jgi:hypothetical protein